jgi:hypothetical protein
VYKLYYDTFPGNRVFQEKLSVIPEYNNGLWYFNKSGNIDNLISLMGIKYNWTNDFKDPNSIVIIEIDSQPSDVVLKIFDMVSRNFSKAIIMTATEPNTSHFDFDGIKKKYPNILFVCNGDHYLNDLFDNIALFPFYLLRLISFSTEMKIHNLKDLNFLTNKKPAVFNHLSKHWTPLKYKMHYTIKKYSHVPNLVSYRPINYDKSIRYHLSMDLYNQLKETHKKLCNNNEKYSSIYPYDDYINKCTPDHLSAYPPEFIKNDPINKNNFIGSTILKHPFIIYQNSYISLVTEIEEGKVLLNNKYTRYYNISEKVIQPILNNHIFAVNGLKGYHTEYLKNKLGFEIFDEIFDYNSIDKDYVEKTEYFGEINFTPYNIMQELNKFKPEMIFDNSKIIAEKIHYNRDLVINPNSSLRQMLKNAFEDILNKYLKMDP